jgi:hypothetical protein
MAPRKKVEVAEETPEPAMPGYDEIAVRAYEIHESGGGEGPLEDWLQAERELLGTTQIAA